MLYNVAQLLKANVGSDLRTTFEDELDLNNDETQIIGPVVGEVRFQRTNQGILATGTLDATVRQQCVRCLDECDSSLHLSFSDLYMPTIEVVSGHPMPKFTEEDAFSIDAHHHLDLSEALRQQIILALPMQPLCSEDCQGLCPTCGINRNHATCACVDESDVRWSALSNLALNFPGVNEEEHK
jgi:uncharacterized protein